jgi:hypothetical protein
MKRTIAILVLSVLAISAKAQKSIDRLFEKYAGSEGFVSITISGNLLNMLRSEDNCRNDHWPSQITEIRILVQDDDFMQVENFYDAVRKDLDSKEFEEFMALKQSKKDIKMLARIDGKIIKELLLVSGGDENFIIQLKGNITIEEAEDLCAEAQNEKGRRMLSELE